MKHEWRPRSHYFYLAFFHRYGATIFHSVSYDINLPQQPENPLPLHIFMGFVFPIKLSHM